MEDVFFTGVLRVKADLGFPEMVPNICVHYNQADKVKRLTHRINKLWGYWYGVKVSFYEKSSLIRLEIRLQSVGAIGVKRNRGWPELFWVQGLASTVIQD